MGAALAAQTVRPKHRAPASRVWRCALAVTIGCSLLMAGQSQALGERPPPSAACQAWSSHIADLINQHRIVHELDDSQFGEIIRRFYEAQLNCSMLNFEKGLAIYETLPIGPIASRPLR